MISLTSYQAILNHDSLHQDAIQPIINHAPQNIHYLFEIINQNFIILTSTKKSSLQKKNALYVTKFLLQSCCYECVTLIQAYLVPAIQKIAVTHNNQNQQSSYRIFKYSKFSKDKTSQTLLAMNILGLGSSIKPHQMFENFELTGPSSFSKSFEKIKKSFQFSQSYISEDLRSKFKENADNFHYNHTQYVNYFMEKTKQFIYNGPQSKESITILPLLKDNYGYINSQVLGFITEHLQNEDNFEDKTSALFLLGQLILWADIEAILMINYSNVLQNMAEKVQQQFAQNSKIKSAKRFKYIKDFLCYMEFWAECMPYDNFIDKQVTDRPSEIVTLYNKLKNNEKIVFPDNPFSSDMKREFNEHMKMKEQKNIRIIEELYGNPNLQNLQEVSSLSVLRSDNFNYMRIKQKINNVGLLLKIDKNHEFQLDEIYEKIKNQEKQIQRYLQEIAQMSDEPKKDTFQLEGELCLQKIRMFDELNKRRIRGKMTFDEFLREITHKIQNISDSLMSRRPFFDSSSEESINSLKSFISRKYSFQNKLSMSKPFTEHNYLEDNSVLKSCQQPIDQLTYSSERQQILNRSNPSFKDCLNISDVLIPVEEKQARMISNLTNEHFSIHSPSKYRYSKSKIKTKKTIESVQKSEQLKVMNSITKQKLNQLNQKAEKKRIFNSNGSSLNIHAMNYGENIKKFNKITSITSNSQEKQGSGELVSCPNGYLDEYDEKTKKKLLKDKVRVIKNENIEIGSKTERQGNSLKITYFITPFKTITAFECECEGSSQLQVEIFPLQQVELKCNKQYKLYLRVQMLEFMYKLPHIKFQYKWQQNKIEKGPQSYESILPALPIKFIEHREIDQNQIEREFLIQSTKRCSEIKITNSILRKGESIHKYIPNLVVLDEDPGHKIVHGTYCIYDSCHFMVKFIIKDDVLWVEGICLSDGTTAESQQILCHYLRIIKKLLEVNLQ